MESALQALSDLLFVVLAARSWWTVVRSRDWPRFQVALLLTVMAGYAVLVSVPMLGGASQPAPLSGQLNFRLLLFPSLDSTTLAWVRLIGSFLFVLQPYLLLRIVRYWRRVGRIQHGVAVVFLLLSWFFELGIRPDRPRPGAALLIALMFVYVEGVGTVLAATAARRSAGVTKRRLAAAALGSGLITLAIFIDGIFSALPNMRIVGADILTVAFLAGGVSYYIGLEPPRWITRTWQTAELRRALRGLAGRNAEERLVSLVDHLSAVVGGALGAKATLVAIGAPPDEQLTLEAGSQLLPVLQAGGFESLAVQPGGLLTRVSAGNHPRASARTKEWGDDLRRLGKALDAAGTVLLAPLVARGQPLGVLLAFFEQRSLFLEEELELLAAIADQAALDFESRRLYLATKRNSEQRETLLQLGQALAEATTVDGVCQRIVDFAPQLLPDTTWSVLLPREDGGLRVAASGGAQAGDWLSRDLPPGAGLSARAVRTGRPVVTDDVLADPDYVALLPGQRSKLVAPLWYGGSAIATLNVESPRVAAFNEGEVDLIQIVAASAALALAQAQLIEQLERQNEALHAASQVKSEFLANMSHELRTPLNGIIGFSELMHDGKAGPITDDQQEFLGYVLASSQHLLALINDVLDLSKVEAGKMEFRPEPVRLADVIGGVLDTQRSVANEKRLRLEFSVDTEVAEVVVDPAKLKQVLYNFVSNALKFTPEGGTVTVSCAPDGARHFRLAVTDTGIGITPEDQQRLFVEFQQLEAASDKRYPGTGLGLALTKRIVQAQGGDVGVTSEPGQGSTFYAVLPRQTSASDEPEVDAPPPARLGAARVLIIEDSVKDRSWMQDALTEAGYAVRVAHTGAEALKACSEDRFDAVTLDLLLPDMHGWEVLRGIRAGSLNSDVPVLVVTIVADKGAAAGFAIQDFLPKPVQPAELLSALERAGVPPDGRHGVLVVDDDPFALKLIEASLGKLGYPATCRDSAADALRTASEQPPAAVVLDLIMPGIDGFEFLNRFRRTPAGRRTPVIIWTSKDLSPEEQALLRASAEAVVLKSHGGAGPLLAALQPYISPVAEAVHA